MRVTAKVKLELSILLGPYSDSHSTSFIAKEAREKAREKMMKLLSGQLGDEHHHFDLTKAIDVYEIICVEE